MNIKAEDRIGQSFGELKIESVSKRGKRAYALCSCSCGNKKEIRLDLVVSGRTNSCGCIRGLGNKSHGMWKTPTYRSWDKMKQRCRNESYSKYYSEVRYDSSWEDFSNFFSDMGERPLGTTLDRKDPKKGYCKDNCRWADKSVQSRNTSTRKSSIPYKGVKRDKRGGSYYITLTKNYKTKAVYGFSSAEEAATGFDYATKFLYKEEVVLNGCNLPLSSTLKSKIEDAVLCIIS